MKSFFKKLWCSWKGHATFPPFMEMWESKNGMQRSYYLCRRCFVTIGERPYVRYE